MSYHATGQMGQIPTNGGYSPGSDGIFAGLGIVPGDPCPPGTQGIFPACISDEEIAKLPSVPTEIPTEFPTIEGGCPAGQIGFPPLCFTPPFSTPGAPPGVEIEPPVEPPYEPPGHLPPGEPPVQPPVNGKAVAGAPTWLVPVLIGVGIVGLGLVIFGARRG